MATLKEVKKRIRTVKSTWEISSTILALVLIAASSGYGFDGRRQGFVLGGGAGLAPAAHWGLERSGGFSDNKETGGGIGLNAILGYGMDSQNIIAYEGNFAGWNSSVYNNGIIQGFNGAAFYHYFSRLRNSGFMALGLGMNIFDIHQSDVSRTGMGVLLGAGVELARHWQLGCYFTFGSSSSGASDYNNYHLSFLVTGIAY